MQAYTFFHFKDFRVGMKAESLWKQSSFTSWTWTLWKIKIICWLTLVILFSAGKWEMKCVICALTIFKLVLCFQSRDLLSGVFCAWRQTRLALDSSFSVISAQESLDPHLRRCSSSRAEALIFHWQHSQICSYMLMYILHTLKCFDLEAESRILMH